MHKFFRSKNYKKFNYAITIFIIICTILTIILPCWHATHAFPNIISSEGVEYQIIDRNYTLYNDIENTFNSFITTKLPHNAHLANRYLPYFVSYIFVTIGLSIIFLLCILRLIKNHYSIHICISIILLIILVITPYRKDDYEKMTEAILSLYPTITYPYNSYLYVGYYFTIFFFAINTIIGIIEFIYRKDIPEYNIDIRKYLPMFRIKVKPRKPTNKERIAELEQQVQELQDKINNQE